MLVNWDFLLLEDNDGNSKRPLHVENTIYTNVLQRKAGGLFWLIGCQYYLLDINNIPYLATEWSPSGYHVLVLFYFHKCSSVTNTLPFFLIFPMASLHSTNMKNKQAKNYPLLFPTHPHTVKLPFTNTCCCHVFQKSLPFRKLFLAPIPTTLLQAFSISLSDAFPRQYLRLLIESCGLSLNQMIFSEVFPHWSPQGCFSYFPRHLLRTLTKRELLTWFTVLFGTEMW